MTAARKFESFCIEPSETWIFAGDISGQISIIDIDKFTVVHTIQAHSGAIQAVAAHRSLPYIAALATDRTVSIWRRDIETLQLLCRVPLRTIHPTNDLQDIPPVHSTSQALGFHDTKPRLITRSANAGVVEIEFSTAGFHNILWCQRLHGMEDLISARFVKDSDQVLTGSIDGQFVLSEEGKEILRWEIGGNVHWAEHLEGTTYLLASDTRAVARIDISGQETPLIGEPFTRDDLEHVTYNHTSGRAFVASFDRTIYEIDIHTCQPTRIAFRPPFKCRWVKTLERSPTTLLVQCRNGGIYKANADTGDYLGEIKLTPNALWTGVHTIDGHILLGGEGEDLLRLRPGDLHPITRLRPFVRDRLSIEMPDRSYTKRIAIQTLTGRLVLGRSSGDVVLVTVDAINVPLQSRTLCKLGSSVRDLAVSPTGNDLYIGCEDGSVYQLDMETGDQKLHWSSPTGQPIWALAHNPERALLVVAERNGEMYILDTVDFSKLLGGIETSRTKRMKFADDHTLLYNKRDHIYRLDLQTVRTSLLVDSQGNTIEDFIWDHHKRYLVLISYMMNITLCDYNSGDILNTVPDQMDYSKGLLWVDQRADADIAPLDFLTFGRSGSPHYFRIHDEKILSLAPSGLQGE